MDHDLTDVHRELSSLRYMLSELDDRVRGARREIDDLEDTCAELTQVGERLERFDEELDETKERVGAVVGQLRRMAARVDWLSRRADSSSAVVDADLETFEDNTAQLVARIVAADRHRASFAGEQAAGWSRTVDQFATYRAQREAQAEAIRSMCAAIRAAREGDEWFTGAGGSFSVRVGEFRTLNRTVMRLGPKAEAAQRKLDADENRRRAAETAVAAGDAALAELRRNRRARLEHALTSGARLPFWFTSSLGYAPPPGSADEWVELAVDVLIHRSVHDVTDQIVALGPAPQQGSAAHAAWAGLQERIGRLS